MSRSLEGISNGAFRAAFVLLGLFVPFSIAGMNVALGVAALAWALWIIDRRGARVRPDGFAVASIALAVSALPATLLSADVPRALDDWRSYWELAICFLVGAHIARVRARETAFWTMAGAAAGACLLAFVQRGGGMDVGPLHVAPARQAGGTMLPATFAGVLCQLVPFIAASAFVPRYSRRRGWLAAIVAVAFAALLLTLARGAWIAVFAGAGVLCLLLRRRVLVLGTAAALAVTVAFTLGFARDAGRAPAGDRVAAARTALAMFRDHPVFGVGTGDYDAEAGRRRADRSDADGTHNVYLRVLATRGLVGFVPFVLYFAVMLRSLARSYSRAGPLTIERYYAAGALAAVAAVMAGALTENNVGDSEVFMALMFLVGIARSPLARESPRPRSGGA